jgi:hypothetical protein
MPAVFQRRRQAGSILGAVSFGVQRGDRAACVNSFDNASNGDGGLRAVGAWLDDEAPRAPDVATSAGEQIELGGQPAVDAWLDTAAQTAPDVADCVNDYDGPLRRAHMCFESSQQRVIDSFLRPSLVEQSLDPEAGQGERMTGRMRLERLRQTLRELGLTFSDDQNEFINRMIAACAKLIFKDDLDSNIDDLLSELNISELHQELMAIMPRRFGKTFSVAAFVVALLSAIEGLEIGIFSTGRRASQKILELVYWFMCKVPGMRERIFKHNVEVIWLQGSGGPDDIRKVSSYPSNVRISLVFLFLFCVLWCLWVSLWHRSTEAGVSLTRAPTH